MRLIDADKLYHDCLTKTGRLAISHSQIADAPTVELDESVIQEVLNKRGMTAVANEYLVALHGNNGRSQGKFECRIKIKDLISMLLEFDMNEKATICTTDESNENNIVISITDMRGNEE